MFSESDSMRNIFIIAGVIYCSMNYGSASKMDHSAAPVIQEAIFDSALWLTQYRESSLSALDFSSFRNSHGTNIIKGAGVLPLIRDADGILKFLCAVAIVENGTDTNIGSDPVYINVSNFPLLSGELSIDMAARNEELGILGDPFTTETIKKLIKQDSCFVPNAGMIFGTYGVPTYLVYFESIDGLKISMLEAERKIKKAGIDNYDTLFPTKSSIKRSDRIIKFDLVPFDAVFLALNNYSDAQSITRPVILDGCAYALSPYVARTIFFNKANITRYIAECEKK